MKPNIVISVDKHGNKEARISGRYEMFWENKELLMKRNIPDKFIEDLLQNNNL